MGSTSDSAFYGVRKNKALLISDITLDTTGLRKKGPRPKFLRWLRTEISQFQSTLALYTQK